MTTSAPSDSAAGGGAPIRPRLTAEQALTRLLELIRTSRTLNDFTPERVSQVMGVEVEFARDGSGGFGFGERITPDWVQNFGMDGHRRFFEFSFDAVDPDASPDMTDICQFDFDRFSSELEAMGFSKKPYYAEHGRLLEYTFERIRNDINDMTIMVWPGQWTEDEQARTRRLCIRMIRVL
ncbi:hypothetical protein [Vulcaniibacterium gelatinicum]|uniref:hypothetical protein n=1 Tax=Vulcaniibacterium gelatinicum TaxID=2598725 RepID=UPI0011C88C00|nr:hypothetical protein [Vulcaniibacterium gelatinicum]